MAKRKDNSMGAMAARMMNAVRWSRTTKAQRVAHAKHIASFRWGQRGTDQEEAKAVEDKQAKS